MDNKPLQIKVCGLRDTKNIEMIASLPINYMGFIFYSHSPRYAKKLEAKALSTITPLIKKVGVFVNETLENILTIIHNYNLDAVQLHGAENKLLCQQIKQEASTMVIKAFPIMDASNFKVTKDYEDVADLFLFDTKTDIYGGSGKKFNWQILNEYRGTKDFLLSGGIAPDDVKAIRKINHPRMIGVDLNSKFETAPGLKNVELLKNFIATLNSSSEESTLLR